MEAFWCEVCKKNHGERRERNECDDNGEKRESKIVAVLKIIIIKTLKINI